MPHICRLDFPGTLHHVMSHCVEGCLGLAEDRARIDFLDRLRTLVEQGQLRLHAWALMSNHYHLIAEPLEKTLSVSLQKLLTGFASAFNSRNSRRGHVFDARFRSILVEKESYFLKLLAYVHLNPLRAGAVGSLDELNDYPWTGHATMIGRTDCPWFSTELVASMLASSGGSWKESYLDLLKSNLGEESPSMDSGNFRIGPEGLSEIGSRTYPASNKRSIRVLGSKQFALEQYEQYRALRGAGLRERRTQHELLESVLHEVAKEFQVSSALIRSGGRGETLSAARRHLIRRLILSNGFTQTDIASFLNISQSAISQIIQAMKYPPEELS
jgi:putative transposase